MGRIKTIGVLTSGGDSPGMNAAIACGAEAAIIPEDMTDADQLAEFMHRGIRKSKKSCII